MVVISYVQQKEGRLTRVVTACLELPYKHVIVGMIEGKVEVRGRRRRRRELLLDDLTEKSILEGGSTRSHPVENSLWKRLWTCRKTDCGMNETYTS
jgi:hypothetical protein